MLVVPSIGLIAFTAQAASAGPSGPVSATTTITTAGETAYTIPAGTTSLTVTVVGAAGESQRHPYTGAASGASGDGGTVTATFVPPTGATTLYAEVGDSSGTNGGGGITDYAYDGGGETTLQTCSAAASGCTYTADPTSDPRLVVAGGGGGGGENNEIDQTVGGVGGNAGESTSVTGPGAGGDGADNDTANAGSGAGLGDTNATAAVGQGAASCASTAGAGRGGVGGPGSGGTGGTGNGPASSAGGGGSGWVGGSGGGAGECGFGGGEGGGGGAGASYAVSTATNVSVSTADAGATPEVIIVALGLTSTVEDNATSTAWSGSETTGSAAFDSAALTDVSPTPTGTLDYFFYDNGTCTGTPATSQSVSVNPDGTIPDSDSSGALAAGAYSYLDSYSGDSTYGPAVGGCETFTVGPAAATTTTTVNDTSTQMTWTGTEVTGAAAYAVATTSGVAGITPTGSVTYNLYSGGACAGNSLQTDSEPLTDGTAAGSASSGALPGGNYSYQASYSGDSSYAASAGSCAAFTVATAPTSTATTVQDAATSADWTNTETNGSHAYDTATVAESVTGIIPTGTETYDFFTNGSCSGSPDSTYQVTLGSDGSVPFSASTAALPVGSYSYSSTYSGDGNYNSTIGTCEPFAVILASPTVSTTVTDAATNTAWTGNETPGSSAYDAGAVTGANVTPTGTVTYSYFTNGSCLGDTTSTDLVTINNDGSVPVSHPTGGLAAGDYSYQATYSGDSVYMPGAGDCEPFSLGLVSSATTSQVTDAATTAAWGGTEVAGASAYDTAKVTGSSDVIPSGSLTYDLYDNDACTGDSDTSQTVTLTGGVVPVSADSAPLAAGSYSYSAVYGGNATFAASAADCEPFTVLPAPPDSYVALAPARILDTRIGTGYVGPLGSGQTITLKVNGAGGIPETDVSAVAVNVTATAAGIGGYLTVYPAGVTRPTTSNVNFTTATDVPNLAIVRDGLGGDIEIYNGAAKSVQVVVDVSGYFTAGNPTTAGAYGALTPARILDSRINLGTTGPTVAAGRTVTLQVTGAGGVPTTGVGAVVLNVTVANTVGGGYLTVYPGGTPRPTTSNIDFVAGTTLAELDVVPVSAEGTVSFYNGSNGALRLVADVNGYFTSGTPTTTGEFGAVAPTRILRTSIGLGASGPVAPDGNVTLTIPGTGGLPRTGVGAVILNVIAVDGTRTGFLTVYPNGESLPGSSNVNYGVTRAVSNLVIVRVGENGQVVFHNTSAGSVQIYADVFGYFSS